MLIVIVVLCVIGMMISLYGLVVENKIKKDMNYHASCDISHSISCTKSFVSPYNKLLGISNITVCLLYYGAMLFLGLTENTDLVMILSWGGLIGTIVFAYVLYFKVKTVCLICTAMYIINIALVAVQYITW
jgi:uncharacterized membrane protein